LVRRRLRLGCWYIDRRVGVRYRRSAQCTDGLHDSEEIAMAQKSSGNGLYEVVWPCGERKQAQRPLAKRLDTLNGKTIAQLWDFLFFGDEVFTVLEEQLRRQFPGVKFVSWREFGSTHAVNEKELLASLPQRFKELGVEAAISSMAC
jgi:hypothetical protein